jgi:hypothetical protein
LIMPKFRLQADDGSLLNAQFQIGEGQIILHSRGGTKGKNETNPDYSVALRLLLKRLWEAQIGITGAWVDSSRVQNLDMSERAILSEGDQGAPPEELFKRMAARMQRVGRAKGASSGNGNSNKRIKIAFGSGPSSTALAAVLKAVPLDIDHQGQSRLPAKELNKVTAEHIWNAIELLLTGDVAHRFGESTDFDLLTDDGVRLPPKAVFGVAASEALGFEVLPKHFSGGESSVSFRLLRAAGYTITAKGFDTPFKSNYIPMDLQWTEGKRRLVTHVKKERGPGLSAAKKDEFRRVHNRLYCERCQLDPISTYGPEFGESCIEVHHRHTQVKDMAEGHQTKLDDLQCLCANCHRIVHREMKAKLLQEEAMPT